MHKEGFILFCWNSFPIACIEDWNENDCLVKSGKSAIWAIKKKRLQIRFEKLYLLTKVSNLVFLTKKTLFPFLHRTLFSYSYLFKGFWPRAEFISWSVWLYCICVGSALWIRAENIHHRDLQYRYRHHSERLFFAEFKLCLTLHAWQMVQRETRWAVFIKTLYKTGLPAADQLKALLSGIGTVWYHI